MKHRERVAVVGGGMVGATLALALAKIGVDVHLIEAVDPGGDSSPSFDDRALALSWGSVRVFESLQLWSMLAPLATAIEQIMVTHADGCGQHRITSRQRGVPSLGQVLVARDAGRRLWQVLENSPVQLLCPMQVTDIAFEADGVSLTRKDGVTERFDLVVAADGAHSALRELAGLGVEQRDYRQTAIVANLQTEKPHHGRALEHFTAHGPVALLPLQERWSLVYTVPAGEENRILALDDAAFLAMVQETVGYRFGRIVRMGKRARYPLYLQVARRVARPGLWLAGNAGHHIHPIAGQGFNLGLRDVAWIVEWVLRARSEGMMLSSGAAAAAYEKSRVEDIGRTVGITDFLARGFQPQLPGMGLIRGAALSCLHWLMPVDMWLSKAAMGMQPPLPGLAAGLTLSELEKEIAYGLH